MIILKLRQLAWALSSAVDLVGVTDVLHGRRVGFIAAELARRCPGSLPWTEDDIRVAGMLHDCGVSSSETHERLVAEMEWNRAEEHCVRGAKLLETTRSWGHLAGAVRLHHQAWEARGQGDPTPDEWLGNLLFVADRVDVLAATQEGDLLYHFPAVVEKVVSLTPRLFSPVFTAALIDCAKVEAFWLLRQEAPLTHQYATWIEEETPQALPEDEVRSLFALFGSCVDGKSEFTASHSRAVSRLCGEFADDLGLGPKVKLRLELAGLVHDIGKLRVPDRVLDFPGPLGGADFSTMKHHSFDALDILSQLEGCEQISEWASMHHERLDGSGYPFQRTAETIPLEVRVLAVADVFQALIQDRPYRTGMPAAQALGILQKESDAHKLDPRVVGLLTARVDDYYALGR